MEYEQRFTSRRTESVDAQGISKLVKRHTEALFGRVDADYVIEHANLSISLVSVSDSKDVVGHISMFDTSQYTVSDKQHDWSTWLPHHYNLGQASPVNSLFLGLFVSKDGFQQGASSELLRTVFMAVPLLQYVFLAVPTGVNIGMALSGHFKEIPAVDNVTKPCDLYLTHRHQHFPILSIRIAKVEDTDDLVPILLKHSSTINNDYGDYFLSELIESQDDHHKTIVAEVEGHAVGLMSVTTVVDVQLLNSAYQLDAYCGLRHSEEDDESISTCGGTQSSSCSPTENVCWSPTPHRSTPTPQSSTTHIPTPHTSLAHVPTPHSSAVHLTTPHSSAVHLTTPHSSTCHVPTPSASAEAPADVISKSVDKEAVTEETIDKQQGKSQVLKCSAVAVQLFAIDERYEMRSIDFLPAVFKLFPDHNFLILTQPHSVGEFPLLAHFSCIPPRSGTSLPQELYVMHKCSLLHSFAVSCVVQSDLEGIVQLVSGLKGHEDIARDIREYLTSKRDDIKNDATPLSAVVAKCSGQVVGVAVLRNEEELNYIRSHYNIEDFVYYSYHRPSEHARLYHLVLSPAFSSYGKHFIKELLRLSQKSCLYYRLTPDPTQQEGKPHTVINTLQHLIPIRPRRQMVYPDKQVLGINAPLSEVTEVKPPFALYHTNKKLTFEPKICISSRVVIVGASDTALSLLEALMFCPHLLFTNITLVSPDARRVWPIAHHLSDKVALLGLNTWMNTVKGTVTGINRADHHLDVDVQGSKSIVQYDWLLFTCGVQYQSPILKGIPPPQGVLTSQDVGSVKGPCVVYGSGVDSYSMVNQLLVKGVAPDIITLVQPATPTCFDDEAVKSRVDESLSVSGVRVLTGVVLTVWEMCDERLSGVQLMDTVGSSQMIHCTSLVYMGEKTVDKCAFKALNDACLVFDKRLVINADHSTNDPHILAAGPLTKFSRKYRIEECSHAEFNSEEVGQRLANTLLSKLDPTIDAGSSNEEDPLIIPPYTQPNVVSCSLPGGLSYLRVSAPPTPGVTPSSEKGRELVTDTSNGYFKVLISPSNRVNGLTVLSAHLLNERENYLCLYSIHEKYLNNLISRFDQSLIHDFFMYFREPWACALFYDRFPDFLQEVREYLSLLPAKDGEEGSVEEKVKAMIDDDQKSPLTSTNPEIFTHFNSSPAKSLITGRLYRFLEYNKQQLPMFARPDII